MPGPVERDHLATLKAVLFQLDHGEASDLLDDEQPSTAARDLAWCRERIRHVVTEMERAS